MAVASSLREIALALIRDLAAEDEPIEVEVTFGASSALARQLSLGAPIDLLISADAEIVEMLAERGLVDPASELEIARGRLVLVAHVESDFAAEGVAALSSPSLERIALPASAIPLGRYARAWLASQELLDPLEGRIVSTEHARATLVAVDQGHADLALVYESDARLGRHVDIVARIDPSTHPAIRYVAVRATRAPECRDIARILRGWGDARTRTRLEQAGFVVDGSSSIRPTRADDGAEPPAAGRVSPS